MSEYAFPSPMDPRATAARAEALDSLLLTDDLSDMTNEQRRFYYLDICAKLGLDPSWKPFRFIVTDDGRLQLYCTKNGGEQLARIHKIRFRDERYTETPNRFDVRVVAYTDDGDQRTAIGSVWKRGLTGQAESNALMHASTKAQRRATLAILGVGAVDETEAVDIPGAGFMDVDLETGQLSGDDTLRALERGAEQRATVKQIGMFRRRARQLGWTENEIAALLARYGYSRPEDLPRHSVFTEVCAKLMDPLELEEIRASIDQESTITT